MKSFPLKVAVAGIGGFAGAHHAAWCEIEKSGVARVVAACDPRVAELDEASAKYGFEHRGVRLFPDFDSMLAATGESLDLVDLVSPIRFHAAQHRACVQRGLPCHLEKPPSLDPEELERMIAVERDAPFATQVGFNHIGQPWRQKLKERLLAGDFGALKKVAYLGLWRRNEAYYRRNSWAGKLLLDDYILLDSCCGNAMAHHLHNILFFAGSEGLMSWASPVEVEAELYRANKIEGADTIFARGKLNNGVAISVAATHACTPDFEYQELLECEKAVIELPHQGGVQIRYRSGNCEVMEGDTVSSHHLVRFNLENYCRYLVGERPRPATLLSDSAPFVHLNALLYLAARRITQVSLPFVENYAARKDECDSWRIPGIETACRCFLEEGKLPSEQGLAWAREGGKTLAGGWLGLRACLRNIIGAA